MLESLLQAPDVVAVAELVMQMFPEMKLLVDRDVRTTAEAGAQHAGSPSVKLFGEEHIEFDRTAMGIMCFVWVWRGDRERFVACQRADVRLTEESFGGLQQFTKRTLSKLGPGAMEALLAFLVVNDLGKLKSLQQELRAKHGIDDMDHDRILAAALERGTDMCPSFAALPEEHRAAILEGLRADFNFGQLLQCENVPASLCQLHGISERALDFYLLHVLFDIAGAAGHKTTDGSLVMDEPKYRDGELAMKLLHRLGELSPEEVYRAYLEHKAAQYHLDIGDPQQYAAARICAMLSLVDHRATPIVLAAIDALPDSERNVLIAELTRSGTDDGYAQLLYYAPSVLNNARRWFAETKEKVPIGAALQACLPAFARVFAAGRSIVADRSGNGAYVVDVHSLAAVAKSDPLALPHARLWLEPKGDGAVAVCTG